MTSDVATTNPRLHQVSPTQEATPTAINTPATTLATLCKPPATVSYIVNWTTSRAVRGASTGCGLVSRCCAKTKDKTAARVVLAVRRPGLRPRRKSAERIEAITSDPRDNTGGSLHLVACVNNRARTAWTRSQQSASRATSGPVRQ